MTYKFQSKACANVLMLQADGDKLLAAMGIVPAPRGILLPEAIPQALESIQAAIERNSAGSDLPPAVRDPGGESSVDGDDTGEAAVSLRQRAWPLVEMLRRALEAREVVVWGV